MSLFKRSIGVSVVLWGLGASFNFPMSTFGQAPFTEEALERGLAYVTLENQTFGKGLAFVDLDGDGDDDLVATGKSDGRVAVWENNGSGYFTAHHLTTNIPLAPKASSVSAADYDNDGLIDLYIGNWIGGPANYLLHNEGDFEFTDMSIDAGVNDAGEAGGCAWGDYDNDGWLDLYVANRTNTGLTTYPNRLFRNLGDGTFQDVAQQVGVYDERLTCQAIFFDLENDGDADLYLSTDKGYATGLGNRMFRNIGGVFTEISDSSGTGIAKEGMGIDATDFDGDGLQDLYITNSALGNPFFLSATPQSFLEVSEPLGVGAYRIGWGTAFLDYNNDGLVDLYVCNMGFVANNNLFVQGDEGPCEDRAALLECDDPATSYCMAVSDIDMDGDLDFVVQNFAQNLKLYINHEGQTRNYIQFDIVGKGHNRNAVGAVVKLVSNGRRQIREVRAGSNYKSQSTMRIHFGLGNVTTVPHVEVRWPGGETRILKYLPVNRCIRVYPQEMLGDLNLDGDIDLLDANPFIEILMGRQPTMSERLLSDFSGDYKVDGKDLVPFIEQLLRGDE